MKKPLKITLWVIGSVLIVFVIFAAIIGYKIKSEITKMHALPTAGETITNVFSINDSFVDLFLIKDGENYVAIDAGNGTESVSTELKKLNINPLMVVAVFLTHTDRDHVGGLSIFQNAKIYLAAEEVQMIDGRTSKFWFTKHTMKLKNQSTLSDQEEIKINNLTIKGILTPGHTTGSMCYVVNGKYLFVGDAFQLKNGKLAKANEVFTMNLPLATKSFDKIAHLSGIEYIFTAHTGLSNNYSLAVSGWEE
jgi:hydroxyacylglutathione hydrolase